jgi:hypothetical protein
MMTTITDEYMQERLSQAREHSLVILRETEKRKSEGADRIVWEHGRRNMALNTNGVLPIVCPVGDGTGIAGIGIFSGSIEETKNIMDDDPGVKAGIFVYEVHLCRGFPGSTLP